MKLWLLLSLLLLSVLIHQSQGIRLIKGSLENNQHNIHVDEEVKSCKGKHCSSGKKKRIDLSKVPKESSHSHHHWLPTIHEDYYGARIHTPKHH